MMILATHVTIALFSIIWTTYGYLRPTNANVRIGYVLAALVFFSGLYLVVSQPAHILHACLSGVAYLAVVMVGIAATRRKLMALESEQA